MMLWVQIQVPTSQEISWVHQDQSPIHKDSQQCSWKDRDVMMRLSRQRCPCSSQVHLPSSPSSNCYSSCHCRSSSSRSPSCSSPRVSTLRPNSRWTLASRGPCPRWASSLVPHPRWVGSRPCRADSHRTRCPPRQVSSSSRPWVPCPCNPPLSSSSSHSSRPCFLDPQDLARLQHFPCPAPDPAQIR